MKTIKECEAAITELKAEVDKLRIELAATNELASKMLELADADVIIAKLRGAGVMLRM